MIKQKSYILPILILQIFCVKVFAQKYTLSYYKNIQKADEYLSAEKFKLASQTYSLAFRQNKWNARAYDRYNAACAWAMANNTDSAFANLNYIIKFQGFKNIDILIDEKYFVPLKKDKRWNKTLELLQKSIQNYNERLDQQLVKQLEILYKQDQKFRANDNLESFNLSTEKIADSISFYDSINLCQIENIISKYGWPEEEMIGEKGNRTIFLIIQHSEINTLKKYLPLIKEAAKNGKTPMDQVAYLEDRILIEEGNMQLYGTQITNSKFSGNDTIFPIEDFKNVNIRRLKMDMEPLENYLERLSIQIQQPLNVVVSNSDFETAIEIKDSIYGPTNVGSGFGKVRDFYFNNSYSESKSAWFKFIIKKDTTLYFDIVSKDPTDDYDFIIFKCSGIDCINDIRSNKSKPDRWCFNDNYQKTGKTGLSRNEEETHIPAGPFSTHAAAINAKAGDLYYLMVTYHYNKPSKGFTIYFYGNKVKKS